MADVDRYGFRLGSKRSIAAKLYERGATQAEVKAATGTTQYNMLTDAQKRGHYVRRDGDRFWLMPAGASPDVSKSGHIRPKQLKLTTLAPLAIRDNNNSIAVSPLNRTPRILEAVLRPPSSGLSGAKANRRAPSLRHKEAFHCAAEHAPIVPAVISIIGWHGDEPPEQIIARKSDDIAKAGMTLWVFQSQKASLQAAQAFGKQFAGTVVYFIESSNAIPTTTARAAREISEDGRKWAKVPVGIGRVTGKLDRATALVLDRLTPCPAMSIDLWRFSEHPSGLPVKFNQVAATACTVPTRTTPAGMVDRYRRVVAVGQLAKPFAVYLR